MAIEFSETPLEGLTPIDWTEGVCQCKVNADDGYTLSVEEGRATVFHDVCGDALWFEPEDIFVEVPVKVTIETCENPGGWHGLERCDCGPEITIELA